MKKVTKPDQNQIAEISGKWKNWVKKESECLNESRAIDVFVCECGKKFWK